MTAPAREHRAGSVRALIVDDATCFRRAARELLERRGFVVVGEADSAATALEVAERLAPDVVLLDVQLPDGSGFDVSAALTRAASAPAVLIVSAEDLRAGQSLAIASGARGFVVKSLLDATELAELLPVP